MDEKIKLLTEEYLKNEFPSAQVEYHEDTHALLGGGMRYRVNFPNGYQMSIVQNDFSYGGKKGLWEIAVIRDEQIVKTDLFDNGDEVQGYLDDLRVLNYLHLLEEM
jgi:hypothetical protein